MVAPLLRKGDRRILAVLADAPEAGFSAVELSRKTGLGMFRTYGALTRLQRAGRIEHRLWPVDDEDFSRTTYRRTDR